jgi:hypothetical protein
MNSQISLIQAKKLRLKSGLSKKKNLNFFEFSNMNCT